MLTNREIATLIILAVVVVSGFFGATVRRSFRGLLRVFFNKTILGLSAIYAFYACGIVLAAWHFGWWSLSLLKETLLVTCITGIGMVFSANRIKVGDVLVKKTARDTLGLTSFVTFYVNLASFSLIVEIVLQLATATIMLLGLAGKHQTPTPKRLVAFLDWSLVAIGGALILYATISFSGVWATQGAWGVLGPLILSIVFPLVLIPFVYMFSFFLRTESLLKKMPIFNQGKPLKWLVSLGLLVGLHLSVKYALSFTAQWRWEVARAATYRDTRALMRHYRRSIREQEAIAKADMRRSKAK